MTIKLGIVMDPIESITIKKDTSFAMMLEAQKRGYEIYYMQISDLYIENGEPRASAKHISVQENPNNFYSVIGEHADKHHRVC